MALHAMVLMTLNLKTGSSGNCVLGRCRAENLNPGPPYRIYLGKHIEESFARRIMRHTNFLLATSVLAFLLALVLQTAPIWSAEPAGGQDQGIQWVTNFDEALARAKAENKPVFLDFFNPN
jgi:hypothetical protein